MTPDQTNAEVLRLLRAIHADVAQMRADMLAAHAASAPAQRSGAGTTGSGYTSGGSSGGGNGSQGGAIADDRDLDGQYGDPTIKYDPKEKYWSGDTRVGYRFSECEPEYLDAMAKYLDACAYMASNDTDEKRRRGATYKTKDAARARGWAQRIRARGTQTPRVAQAASVPADSGEYYGADAAGGSTSDDDIPF